VGTWLGAREGALCNLAPGFGRGTRVQGDSVEDASSNLREAVELFLESADPSEVAARMHGEVFVAALEVRAG
jgi:hypothetical protein